MKQTPLRDMPCPIAKGLDRVGEWWSLLILRDAFYGVSRYDDFQTSLGIASNTLTRRLAALVDEGILARCAYSSRPNRYEYLLTDKGRDLRPVLVALLAWGNRHYAPDGALIELADLETGDRVDPVLVDRRTGRSLEQGVRLSDGPSADEALRDWIRRGVTL
ncbi:winged helix-turn-helix transcriptional regulator [Methylopila turkensis]|uniref:Transcriptional regulator n=1 Tax=Methylopila turkensis TaxID=1437816 RepID=A0A9W6N788_9HYPH|nr:helix-turn-helix domain-containing protein [Methylopila turkensis]GLK80111.1 transcriptional regulator [Methylopila turkensis]